MGVIVALISGFFGPGDSFFRFSDLGMWVAIIWATMLATLVYGMLFATLGVMWKHGIIIAIPFAAWELGMAIVSMNEPNASILNFSVIGWCLSIIDVAGEMVWPDQQLFIALGQWAGTGSNSGWWNSLPGAEPLDFFYSPSTYGIGLVGTLALCTTVLLVQASTLWFIGGQMFKGKEIE